MGLIGICGKAGVGKDYIADRLSKLLPNSIKWSFADQLKVNVMTHRNIPFQSVYLEKDANTRILLQREGTENGRDVHGHDIWIRYLLSWVKVLESKGFEHVIVPDLRFQNELECIKSHSGVSIKVVASGRHTERFRKECKGDTDAVSLVSGHASECDMDAVPDCAFDYVLQNDYADDLHSQLSRIFPEILKNVTAN